MKITNLTIENFLTIGFADLALSDKGLVLIQGENGDDASADSNGAGKSSIPDALCWALYGETAREVKGDAVINHTAKKNTRVEAIIKDGSDVYQIVRYRKHKEFKNRLMVFVNGEDKTKGTDALTQDFICQLIGCSLDVFRAAVYAGQEAMPDLPGMTDKQLKVLVEESAGIDKLQKAHEIAKAKLREVKTRLTDAMKTAEALSDRKSYHEKELRTYESDVVRWEESRKTQIAEANGKIAELKKQFDERRKTAEKFDKAAVEKELEEIKAKITAVSSETLERDRLAEVEKKAASDLAIELRSVSTMKELLTTAKNDLERIEHKVGESCSECGKPHTEDDIADLRKIAVEKIATIEKKLVEQIRKTKGLTEASESASERLKSHIASMTNVAEEVERERALRMIMSDHEALSRAVERLKSDLVSMVNKSKALSAEENPIKAIIKSLTERIAETDKEIETQAVLIDALTADVVLHADAEEVFGQSGVRAHILDTVTPFLNERTSHYLSTMSDGNIVAEWSTLTTTAKGELREKFNIEVRNDKGADSFKGLSGGEKRKVRLSTAMALQDMVASRATKPIELFIADEVDHALDEAGLERLMGILNEKATERGTVLVISHNELGDWIRDHAVVTKTGGYSSVTGVICRR